MPNFADASLPEFRAHGYDKKLTPLAPENFHPAPHTRHFIRFLSQWVQQPLTELTILDLGCGRGDLVAALRAMNVRAFGAEIDPRFVEAGTLLQSQFSDEFPILSLSNADGRSVFPDGYFDLVTTDQVLEHVADLESVSAEIARVLKPGGKMLHQFPARFRPIEPHYRLPLVHWLPKTAIRRNAISLLLKAGLARRYFPDYEADERTEIIYKYSVEETFYRPLSEIIASFAGHGIRATCLDGVKALITSRFGWSGPVVSATAPLVARFRTAVIVGEKEKSPTPGVQLDFSVIIPLFNKAPHVEGAVRSALGQSLQPREVIVIDDGSTDGSLQLVQAIKHPSLKILSRSPPGPGGYAARNFGILAAKGEWIAFLDADDRWRPDHLKCLSEAVVAAGDDVGCVFSALETVEAKARHLYQQSSRYLVPGKALSCETVLRAWLDKANCPIWTGATAFRRQLLLEAGMFPEIGVLRGGDKDLWLRALVRTKAAYSPRPTAEFHQATVNRVSLQTGHRNIPVITRTIAKMVHERPELAPLLKTLSNQEIVIYARYSAGAGAPNLKPVTRLYYPRGLLSVAKMGAYFAVGLPAKLFRSGTALSFMRQN